MAMNVSEDFLDELACSICLESYKDPRILPCVHSFCLLCLEQWMKKSPDQTRISCPLCKDSSTVPTGGVKQLKNNFFIEGLLERFSKFKLTPTGHSCSFGNNCSNLAVFFCAEGCGNLCESCFNIHQSIRSSVNHKIMSVNDTTATDVEQHTETLCPTHPGERIHLYCTDCDLAACSTCLLLNHRQHHLVELSEQAHLSGQQLHGLLKKIDDLLETVDQQVMDRIKYKKKSADDIQQVKQQIDAMVSSMISKLNKRKREIFNNLDDVEAQRDKTMSAIADEQEFSRTAITSLRSYSQYIIKKGREIDSVMQAKDIELRYSTLYNAMTPSFVWVFKQQPNRERFDALSLANVSFKTHTMEPPPSAAVDISGHTRLKKLEQVVKNKRVTGMALLHNTLWLVHSEQSELHAIPLTSQHQPQTFTLHGLTKPQDLVRFPPDESQLVISNFDKGELLWVNVKMMNASWQVTSQRSVKVGYSPLGLATRGDVLLSCDGDSIRLFSTAGKQIQRVMLPKSVKPCKAVPQPTSPGYVVLDRIRNQVVMVNEKGEVQHTYRGQKGFDPYGFTRDDDNIYITDGTNHRVHRLGLDGRYGDDLLTQQQGLVYPTRLCVDQSGRIYIAHGETTTNSRELLILEPVGSPNKLALKKTTMELSVTWCN